MPTSSSTTDAELDVAEELADTRIYIKNAGGVNHRFVLYLEYAPTERGKRKRVHSNTPSYGKSWESKEQITQGDKHDFVRWVNSAMATGGGRKAGHLSRGRPPAGPLRSSERVGARLVAADGCFSANIVVEKAVLQCVQLLVHTVERQSRWDFGDRPAQLQVVNRVASKRRHAKAHIGARDSTPHRQYRAGMLTKRMQRARLSQRKSRGYLYRRGYLQDFAARRMEANLSWLQAHQHRLATIIARQDLHKLLPEGMAHWVT